MPHRFFLPLVLSALGLMAGGCTSWKLSQPAAPPITPLAAAPHHTAKVCVVRTSVLGQAVTFPTRDNGVLVGATRGRGHFCWFAEPGEHDIDIEADEVEHAHVTAVAGRAYFLKQEVDNVFGYVKCRAVWLEAREAKDAFDDTPYETLSGVPGSEKLPELTTNVPARNHAAAVSGAAAD